MNLKLSCVAISPIKALYGKRHDGWPWNLCLTARGQKGLRTWSVVGAAHIAAGLLHCQD